MIDLKLLRENPDLVRASQRARGEDPGLVDALLEADAARRSAVTAADTLRAEQKAVSKRVGKASPDERPALLEQAKAFAKSLDAALEHNDGLADEALKKGLADRFDQSDDEG